jgi:hypothetical protein
VQVSWRRDLEDDLSRFVAAHRGLRLGRLFGARAAFAGRRVFSSVTTEGITVRLPDSAIHAALARGATRWAPDGRPRGEWVIFRRRSTRAGEIAPFLEIAARHVALEPVHPHS